MSALNKITEGILEQANEKANGILAEANKLAAEILLSGESDRAEQEALFEETSNHECREIADRASSADRQNRRRELLRVRNQVVGEVISEAKAKIAGMPDKDYFDFMFRLFEKNAQQVDGVIRFASADFNRIPGGFLDRCKQLTAGHALELSMDTDGISHGFVIQYGDIFQNCSLDSVFEAEEQALRDMAYAVLAGDENEGY